MDSVRDSSQGYGFLAVFRIELVKDDSGGLVCEVLDEVLKVTGREKASTRAEPLRSSILWQVSADRIVCSG